MAGASKALSGTILRIGKRCIVTLSLVDLRKSAKEAAGQGRGNCTEDGVLESVDKALAQLVGDAANEPVATDTVAPVRPAPPTEDYDALLRRAEAAERRARADKAREDRIRADRQKKLETAWTKVSKIATTRALNRRARVRALQAFLRDYPSDNPHLETAQGYLAKLRRARSRPVRSGTWSGYLAASSSWGATRGSTTRAKTTRSRVGGCL